MKKFLVAILMLVLIVEGITVSNVTAESVKLTDRELAIVKADVQAVETNNYGNIGDYIHVKSGIGWGIDDSKRKLINPSYKKEYNKDSKSYNLYTSGIWVSFHKYPDKISMFSAKLGMALINEGNTVYGYKEDYKFEDVKEVKPKDLTESQLKIVEDFLINTAGRENTDKFLYATNKSNKKGYTGLATVVNPVPLKTEYTWKSTYDYLDDTVDATFGVTVNNVKKLKESELSKYNMKKKDGETYFLANITWNVKKYKFTKVGGDGYMFKSGIYPTVFGTESEKYEYLVKYSVEGFDGSLVDNVADKFKYSKINDGESISFKITGNVVVAAANGNKDRLIIQTENSLLGLPVELYFSLK